MNTEQKNTNKLVINQCSRHGFYSVSIEDDNGGTRVTPSKCCGSWSTLREWKLSPDEWLEIAQLATTAGGEAPRSILRFHPIETAPKDNKVPLLLARFDDKDELQELDFDGIWQTDSESWEMPEVYYYWASTKGIEEPTHRAYQNIQLVNTEQKA